jgi:hypothetical protein
VGSDIKSSVATDGTTHLYFGASDGKFRAVRITPRDGGGLDLKVDWEFKTRREIYSSAALAEGTVYFGSMDGHLYALEAASGRLRWQYATYSPVASSPTLSADAKLFAGAANGKLYALDARTGQRLWSFQTSPETSQKANLDSSPTLDSAGNVWVGSYQGKLHRVGIAHCPLHPEDSRCEFGGTADTPAFGMSQLPESGAYLRYEDANGRYGDQASHRIGRAQPIHLRLAVYNRGRFVDDAAISAAGIHVRARRDGQALARGELAWSVSSDGKYLNLEPVSFLGGGSHYEVEISGSYYRQSDWLGDRLQWLTTHPFEDKVSFDTEPELASPALPGPGGGWLLHSLYLTQPKALDTYIPAALDGQDFVVEPVGLTPGDSRLLLAVLPALPAETGFELLAEPARATAIEATLSGDAIRARGSFRLSAMGGVIPFKEVDLFAGLDSQGNLREAQLRAVASCLGMQGNGSSYHFPWSIVDQLCDPYLRMIGYVVLRSELLADNGQAGPLQAELLGDGARIRITGKGLPQGDSLVTAILYDAGSRHILAREFERATTAGGAIETSLSGIGKRAGATPGSVLQLLVGMRAAEPIRAARAGN